MKTGSLLEAWTVAAVSVKDNVTCRGLISGREDCLMD